MDGIVVVHQNLQGEVRLVLHILLLVGIAYALK